MSFKTNQTIEVMFDENHDLSSGVSNVWVPHELDAVTFTSYFSIKLVGEKLTLLGTESPTSLGSRSFTEPEASFFDSYIGYPMYLNVGGGINFLQRSQIFTAWLKGFISSDNSSIELTDITGEMPPPDFMDSYLFLNEAIVVADLTPPLTANAGNENETSYIITQPGRADFIVDRLIQAVPTGLEGVELARMSGIIPLSKPIRDRGFSLNRTSKFVARVMSSRVEPEIRDIITGVIVEESEHILTIFIEDRFAAGLGATPTILSRSGVPPFQIGDSLFFMTSMDETEDNSLICQFSRAS